MQQTCRVGQSCGENAQCVTCGPVCEQKCGQPTVSCPRTQNCLNNYNNNNNGGQQTSNIRLPATGKCQCNNGFLRNTNGQCVRQQQCNRVGASVTTASPLRRCQNNTASSCGQNERCNLCGNACEQKCGQQTKLCPLTSTICRPTTGRSAGICECQPGFSRHANGRCVRSQQCNVATAVTTASPLRRCQNTTASSCGQNERCNLCGNACEQKCGQQTVACPQTSSICRPTTGRTSGVCQCQSGFSRHANGRCVRSQQCNVATAVTTASPLRRCQNTTASSCGQNERCNMCGNACEQKCGQQSVSGFSRHANGRCVRSQQCNAIRNGRDIDGPFGSIEIDV
ncbi:unnamed protein product, partial [Mesorhabditis spiculigera]